MRATLLALSLSFGALGATTEALAQQPAAPQAVGGAPSAGVARGRGRRAAARLQGPVASFPAFEMLPEGGSRISVHVNGPVTVTEHASAGALSYVLTGARIDESNNANALETFYFNTPVLRARLHVLKKEKKAKSGDVELAIALRADAKPSYKLTEQKGGAVVLTVDFPAGSFVNADTQTMDRPPSPPPAARADKPAKSPRGRRAASVKPGPPVP